MGKRCLLVVALQIGTTRSSVSSEARKLRISNPTCKIGPTSSDWHRQVILMVWNYRNCGVRTPNSRKPKKLDICKVTFHGCGIYRNLSRLFGLICPCITVWHSEGDWAGLS